MSVRHVQSAASPTRPRRRCRRRARSTGKASGVRCASARTGCTRAEARPGVSDVAHGTRRLATPRSTRNETPDQNCDNDVNEDTDDCGNNTEQAMLPFGTMALAQHSTIVARGATGVRIPSDYILTDWSRHDCTRQRGRGEWGTELGWTGRMRRMRRAAVDQAIVPGRRMSSLGTPSDRQHVPRHLAGSLHNAR